MTTNPVQTTLVIVPDHRLLRVDDEDWCFDRVIRDIHAVSSPDGPQDVRVYLAFPEMEMREVDMQAVANFVQKVSDELRLRIRFETYSVYDGPTYFPIPFVKRSGSSKPKDRRLTVHLLVEREFEAIGNSWWLLLSHVGIRPTLPLSDGQHASLETILEAGFDHMSRAPFISVLLHDAGSWDYGAYIKHFTATGG
jgi:hypothetical protein